MKTNWKLVLTQGLLTGSLASIFSVAMMATAGRRESGSASTPVKAASRWLGGEEAFGRLRGADLSHTTLGFLTQHGAATLWAAAYAADVAPLHARKRVPALG